MHGGQGLRPSDGLTGGIEFLFKKNKVDWLKGHAEVHQRKDSIDVAGTSLQGEAFRHRHRLQRHPAAGR